MNNGHLILCKVHLTQWILGQRLLVFLLLETPLQQQNLFLPIVSLGQCERVYGKTLPISEEQVCAGGEREQDACSGFGGAPLLVRHSETYYQVLLGHFLLNSKLEKVFKVFFGHFASKS